MKFCSRLEIVVVTFFLLFIYVLISLHLNQEKRKAFNISRDQENYIQDLEETLGDLRMQLREAEKTEKELMLQIEQLRRRSSKEDKNEENVKGTYNDLDLMHFPRDTFFGCKQIDRTTNLKIVGKGQTKEVQEGKIFNRVVAIKSASYEAPSVQSCLREKLRTADEAECFLLSNYKILKEAFLLHQLDHPQIVRLLGFCVRSEEASPQIRRRGVSVAVESGVPVQLHLLSEKSWLERVELCIQIAQLLQYLAESPIGSVVIPDFRDEQFVMVGSQIKLADLDDINAAVPKCDKNLKCSWSGGQTGIPCSRDMKCPGMNAYLNLQRAKTVFLAPLLMRGIPDQYKKKVEKMLKQVMMGNLDAEDVVNILSELLHP